MKSKNLQYAFFIEYYDKQEKNNFAKLNEEIISLSSLNKSNINSSNTDKLSEKIQDVSSLEDYKNLILYTTYPGLVVGGGLSHQCGGEGEAQLGFSFDYVTGIPYIPGSTVKGVIRSAFEGEKRKHVEWWFSSNKINIDDFVKRTFDGILDENNACQNGKDIFFDAFAIKEKTSILATDNITPHLDDKGNVSEIKNPNPITFIKVRSNVGFEFRFRLADYNENFKADNKLELYKSILIDLGIGAKTNVGYGFLSENKLSENKINDQEHKTNYQWNKTNYQENKKKCPYCSTYNSKFLNGKLSSTWKKNICFKCGNSLGLK